MRILLDASAKPPLFRFSDEAGRPVSLFEIRITEVGESGPSWWLVHSDVSLEEAVALNLITAEEAEDAGVPVIRDITGDQTASLGVTIQELRYGLVPDGFQQRGSLRELKPNHLYELVASGPTVGELEFYA